MNSRERFLAIMNFEQADRAPLWEFGYWGSTIRRWYREGLPCSAGISEKMEDGDIARGEALWWDEEKPPEKDIHNFFSHDAGMRHVLLNNYFAPEFVEEVLEEHRETEVVRDKWGSVESRRKDRGTLSHVIRGPVQTCDDWERIKAERLQPMLDGRLPTNWEELKEEYRRRNYPLALGGSQGFFGTARRLLGDVSVLTAFIEQPDLVHNIMDYLAEFWCAIYDRTLNQIGVDFALIWEDMCYKNGSLISPAHFRKFMLAPYKKVCGVFRDHGIKVILVDTDGNCLQLIPLFLEGGVTGLYPFEVAAGMDVVRMRQAFPKLHMLGGIDKRVLAAGPAAIDTELEAKVPPLLKSGGFIPHIDHAVPSDVSWTNFVYYRRRLNEIIVKTKTG